VIRGGLRILNDRLKKVVVRILLLDPTVMWSEKVSLSSYKAMD
jgi:hypothetical protein